MNTRNLHLGLWSALFAGALAGCDNTTNAVTGSDCVDNDNDGHQAGVNCASPDCDDTDPLHWDDCITCSDVDGDGRGPGCDPGVDCDVTNPAHWDDCETCTDSDADGRGTGCNLGPDCDDNDPDNWTMCSTCEDRDGDDWYVGCDAYKVKSGPDCDDASTDAWHACFTCADADGDGRWAHCDRYAAHQGIDCNDSNANAWNNCDTCADGDRDGYWVGCDNYVGLAGMDCDDTSAAHWNDCTACVDADRDGYGANCNLGADCGDTDPHNWTAGACTACVDADADGYYVGCDDFFGTRPGPDCNDADGDNWDQCATCVDTDADGHFASCDRNASGTHPPDCNDANTNAWDTCGTCIDRDGDGRFVLCNRYDGIQGPDCDDLDENVWTACATCVDVDNDGWYQLCDAYVSYQGPDCNDAAKLHWKDCGICIDLDGDGRGNGCDLGTDCNDTAADPEAHLHWADCAVCDDQDGDGYGASCDLGYDCNDSNAAAYPGAIDLAFDGVDQDCDGFDGITRDDSFEGGADTRVWSSISGDAAVVSSYAYDGSSSLDMGGGRGTAVTVTLDTSSCTQILWGYFGKRGPESPDGGDYLQVEYFNGTSWVAVDTWYGQSIDDPGFGLHSGVITNVGALQPSFRMRLVTAGSGNPFDDFYIDSFAFGCAGDADGDLTLDFWDCAPIDPAHWDDCGLCVDGDGDDYGAGCNLGADCLDTNPAVNPGAADLTIDGTDQNCDGFDGIARQDRFDTGAYDPRVWATVSGDAGVSSAAAHSGTSSFNLGGGGGMTTSVGIDTSTCSQVVWGFFGKRGPTAPNNGIPMYVQYDSTGAGNWVTIDTLTGNGSTDSGFTLHQGTLTGASALHANFRMRIYTNYSWGYGWDDFFIDDFGFGCYGDADADGTYDPFDCSPTNPYHWTDCGLCTDNDADNYGAGCNLGPDCNDGAASTRPGGSDTTVDGVDQDCNGVDGLVASQSGAGAAIFDWVGVNAVGCGTVSAAVSQIILADAGFIRDLAVGVNITHTNDADVDIFLRYQNGLTDICVELSTDNGVTGDNYTSTIFDAQAPASITTGVAPFTGWYIPEGSFAALLTGAIPVAGTYTLYVSDDTATWGADGQLVSWSLAVGY